MTKIDITSEHLKQVIKDNDNMASIVEIRDSLNRSLKPDNAITVEMFQKKLNKLIENGCIYVVIGTKNKLKRKYYSVKD
jgi:hypothetical protein